MEHCMPNELRELVWRRLPHRDLCVAAAVSRRWFVQPSPPLASLSPHPSWPRVVCLLRRRDEVQRAQRAWYLGPPKATKPVEANDFLLAVLAVCPGVCPALSSCAACVLDRLASRVSPSSPSVRRAA
jgi:hypothetical protein